jgi:hypothetical protein
VLEWMTLTSQKQLLSGSPKGKLKSKLDNMKHLWKVWDELLGVSGYSKYPHTGFIVADEGLGEAYCLAHPKAKRFFEERLPHEEMLNELFSRILATGVASKSL